MSLPQGTIDWSAVCDCGISWHELVPRINEECYTECDQCRDDQTANVGTSMSRASI